MVVQPSFNAKAQRRKDAKKNETKEKNRRANQSDHSDSVLQFILRPGFLRLCVISQPLEKRCPPKAFGVATAVHDFVGGSGVELISRACRKTPACPPRIISPWRGCC